MTVAGLPGIPNFMVGALNRMVEESKDRAKEFTALGKPNHEECGLFLFWATDWTPEYGWQGEIHYQSIKNNFKNSSGFQMDLEDAQKHIGEAISQRESVVSAASARYGWDQNTPWYVAFRARASVECDVQHMDIDLPPERKNEIIEEFLRQEQLDLGQAWDKRLLDFLVIDKEPGSFVPGSVLSAPEWMFIRGINVLAGMGHSHPSGNAEISPEDYLATNIMDAWRDIFQGRMVYRGQSEKSLLESNKSVGFWIYGLPERVEFFDATHTGSNMAPGTITDEIREGHQAKAGAVNMARWVGESEISRYDKRGLRGKWRGPF